MRFIRAAVCLLLMAVLSAACSSTETTITAGEPAPFDAVLIDLFGTTDTEAYLVTAQQEAAELVATCMNAAGFEYEIQAVPTELAPPDPTSLEDARTMGFGIVADYRHQISQITLEDAISGDPNLAYLSTLTAAEIDRFLIALNGITPEAGQRAVDRGCNGDASDSAYGDWVRFSEELPNYTALGEERDTHPDWVLARDEWRACMVGRGFDYAEPEVIRTNVITRMRTTVSELYPDGQPPLVQEQGNFVIDPSLNMLLDELAQFEQDAAVANVECTAPVAKKFDAVERLVQQEFVDRNRSVIDSLLADR